MEKGWRNRIDEAKDKIIGGKRRGVCDGEGRTVKAPSGRPIARPRVIGRNVKTKCYKCGQWYKRGEPCGC